jgi:hypothetical protein
MMSARTTPSPKTAALEALIEAHAIELKLPTVKTRFRAMAAEATREQQTPTAYLAALLEAEVHERSEWAASGMCRQVRLILPPSFGHRRRSLPGCVRV